MLCNEEPRVGFEPAYMNVWLELDRGVVINVQLFRDLSLPEHRNPLQSRDVKINGAEDAPRELEPAWWTIAWAENNDPAEQSFVDLRKHVVSVVMERPRTDGVVGYIERIYPRLAGANRV